MSGPIDPVRIGIQLDRAEQSGLIETDVAAWLRAILRDREPVVGRFDIDVLPRAGCTAWHATEHAAEVSRRLGRPVTLVFNGERIACLLGDVPDQVFERYLASLDRPRPFTVDTGRGDG